jgi:hypothetical protein
LDALVADQTVAAKAQIHLRCPVLQPRNAIGRVVARFGARGNKNNNNNSNKATLVNVAKKMRKVTAKRNSVETMLTTITPPKTMTMRQPAQQQAAISHQALRRLKLEAVQEVATQR